jgi:hypothetical protein
MLWRKLFSSCARWQKSIDVIASMDVVRSVPYCVVVLCSKRVKARDIEIMLCNIERHG